jgi:hypothetical protein
MKVVWMDQYQYYHVYLYSYPYSYHDYHHDLVTVSEVEYTEVEY